LLDLIKRGNCSPTNYDSAVSFCKKTGVKFSASAENPFICLT